MIYGRNIIVLAAHLVVDMLVQINADNDLILFKKRYLLLIDDSPVIRNELLKETSKCKRN